jgi:hypothetical protein
MLFDYFWGGFMEQLGLPGRLTEENKLFDSFVHGWSAKACHDRIDGKYPTLTVVTLKDGVRFGAYVEGQIQASNVY